jgi:ribosomal protein L11 methyltransferase
LVEEGPGRLAAFSDQPWDAARFREELLLRLAAARPRAADAAPFATSGVEVIMERVEEEDWLRRWKEGWHPTPLGKNLLVVPAWWSEPIDSPRAQVRLDPGSAFGTGTHITTALAWELLEESLAQRRPRLILDVGTGSGILSLGLRALDPSLRAVGTEADPQALSAWRANRGHNRAGEETQLVHARELPFSDAVFDLAAANLTEREHRSVETDLARVLRPRARLVLSGFLQDQAPAALARWRERGFQPEAERSEEGWTALRLSSLL